MAVCCVLPLLCGGLGVSTLVSCKGGVYGYFVTSMLKMSASLFSADVCYSPS